MDTSTLKARLETASESFKNLELQLADPDVASDPKKLESIARERSRLEPLVLDYEALINVEKERNETKNLLREAIGDEDMETLVKAVAGGDGTRPPMVASTMMAGGSKEMAVPPPETDVPLILTSPAFRVPAT